MICDLPGFRWPRPIRSSPSERDRNKRCAYHKDHGYSTEACRSLHYLVDDLLNAGHLKQCIRAMPKNEESSHGQGSRALAARVRAMINYIHGGPLDDEYSSKRKRQIVAGSHCSRTHKLHPARISQRKHPPHKTLCCPAHSGPSSGGKPWAPEAL